MKLSKVVITFTIEHDQDFQDLQHEQDSKHFKDSRTTKIQNWLKTLKSFKSFETRPKWLEIVTTYTIQIRSNSNCLTPHHSLSLSRTFVASHIFVKQGSSCLPYWLFATQFLHGFSYDPIYDNTNVKTSLDDGGRVVSGASASLSAVIATVSIAIAMTNSATSRR